MNDKEKLISLLILADPNPYICESESGSCELTTCTECRARSTADLLIENDFLPVVRCKDCKHYKPQKKSAHWENRANYCNRIVTIKTQPYDFCSYGERKNEVDE